MMRDHYVYWVQDTDGEFLYIGCTRRPQQRYEQHMRGEQFEWRTGWFNQFETRWRLRGPLTMGDALALEAQEIEEKQPIFNVKGVPGRQGRRTNGVVSAYFHSHGLIYPQSPIRPVTA
jgi:predicted GIY-YIG superfamily endonuclease